MYTICMPLYLYIYIIHVYKGWRGGKGRNQPFVKQPHRYATTLPPKKRGKKRSMQKTVFLESACTTTAANNSAWWSSSEHGWFRPCSEELHYANFFVAVVVHAESTNTMFCIYLVFFLEGGSM